MLCSDVEKFCEREVLLNGVAPLRQTAVVDILTAAMVNL